MNLSTLLLLVFLVGMWAALLVGPIIQRRGSGGTRRGDSMKSFQRQLSVLDQNQNRHGRDDRIRSLAAVSNSRAAALRRPAAAQQAPVRGRQAAQRRKHIVTLLAGVAFSFLVLCFLGGTVFLVGLVVSMALLISYVGLMFHLLGTQAEREMKVAFLPHHNHGAEPTALLQLREASAGRR